MDKIEQIEVALRVVKQEYDIFDKKKTGSASTKVRGALLVMRKLTDEMRKEVLVEIKDIRAKRKAISERVESEVKSEELPASPPVLTRAVNQTAITLKKPKRKSKTKPSLMENPDDFVLPADF
jgi:hypothetical protein